MKYWNKARTLRVRERRKRKEQQEYLHELAARERSRTYTDGDDRKNSELMLEALGSKIRRRMIERLAKEGAMSLSKLSEPLRLRLTAAQFQLRILERARIVTTHKRGRVRVCVYNPGAFKELARWLITGVSRR